MISRLVPDVKIVGMTSKYVHYLIAGIKVKVGKLKIGKILSISADGMDCLLATVHDENLPMAADGYTPRVSAQGFDEYACS